MQCVYVCVWGGRWHATCPLPETVGDSRAEWALLCFNRTISERERVTPKAHTHTHTDAYTIQYPVPRPVFDPHAHIETHTH